MTKKITDEFFVFPAYHIEELIFCPNCESTDIDVGKNRGFEGCLTMCFVENTCNTCGENFDADIGMVSYTSHTFNVSKYIKYAGLEFKNIQPVKNERG